MKITRINPDLLKGAEEKAEELLISNEESIPLNPNNPFGLLVSFKKPEVILFAFESTSELPELKGKKIYVGGGNN